MLANHLKWTNSYVTLKRLLYVSRLHCPHLSLLLNSSRTPNRIVHTSKLKNIPGSPKPEPQVQSHHLLIYRQGALEGNGLNKAFVRFAPALWRGNCGRSPPQACGCTEGFLSGLQGLIILLPFPFSFLGIVNWQLLQLKESIAHTQFKPHSKPVTVLHSFQSGILEPLVRAGFLWMFTHAGSGPLHSDSGNSLINYFAVANRVLQSSGL